MRGLTIADLVQQVLYLMYRVRLDVDESQEGSFHCKSDKFKEIVMEANFTLQELQKEQDWNFLRDRLELGITRNPPHGIQEVTLPDDVYKVCTGYNDAVRLHRKGDPMALWQVPWQEARSGSHPSIEMFDRWGRMNVDEERQTAFYVGQDVTFYRPWRPAETGLLMETDVIRQIEPLHICDSSCPDHCPRAYEERVLTWMPDPYYVVVRTAARRAVADPSCSEIAQSLADEASKFLSAVRENDSAHTTTDTWETNVLGYIEVL